MEGIADTAHYLPSVSSALKEGFQFFTVCQENYVCPCRDLMQTGQGVCATSCYTIHLEIEPLASGKGTDDRSRAVVNIVHRP